MKQLNEQEIRRLLEVEKKFNESKEKQKMIWRKREARRSLYVQKAQQANIVVTDEEIEQYLKEHSKN